MFRDLKKIKELQRSFKTNLDNFSLKQYITYTFGGKIERNNTICFAAISDSSLIPQEKTGKIFSLQVHTNQGRKNSNYPNTVNYTLDNVEEYLPVITELYEEFDIISEFELTEDHLEMALFSIDGEQIPAIKTKILYMISRIFHEGSPKIVPEMMIQLKETFSDLTWFQLYQMSFVLGPLLIGGIWPSGHSIIPSPTTYVRRFQAYVDYMEAKPFLEDIGKLFKAHSTGQINSIIQKYRSKEVRFKEDTYSLSQKDKIKYFNKILNENETVFGTRRL